MSLHRASLGPDGEPSTENKRDVKLIVESLTEPPKVASYSTIRGWITAARKATVKYGDKVEEKFRIQRRAGAPSLASKDRLMAFTQSETRLQKSGWVFTHTHTHTHTHIHKLTHTTAFTHTLELLLYNIYI